MSEELEEAMSRPGVVGASTIDTGGLPLVSKGDINDDNAGVLVAAVDKATMIHGDRSPPTVIVDLEGGMTLLVKQKRLRTTVIKKKTGHEA